MTKEALMTQLQWEEKYLTPEVLDICQNLCRDVCRRSAEVMACVIAVFAKESGRLQPAMGGVTVAIDGSVYTKNKEYREDFMKGLVRAIGPDLAALIKPCIANDGSGLGAAILASTPDTESQGRNFSPNIEVTADKSDTVA